MILKSMAAWFRLELKLACKSQRWDIYIYGFSTSFVWSRCHNTSTSQVFAKNKYCFVNVTKLITQPFWPNKIIIDQERICYVAEKWHQRNAEHIYHTQNMADQNKVPQNRRLLGCATPLPQYHLENFSLVGRKVLLDIKLAN